jgi:hypothetical protein
MFLAVMAAGSFAQTRPEDPPPAQPPPEDLGRRLVHKAVSGQDEDPMTAIVHLMDQAAEQLELRFDPGEQTQDTQRRIVAKLDEVLQAAAERTRKHSKPKSPPKGDKRTRPQDSKAEAKNKGGEDPDQAGTENPSASSPAPEVGPLSEELHDGRRAWGNLPARDRDEILQGAKEQSLERYQAWIEEYFRALQEPEP